MPIEVRELVIKATVVPDASGGTPSAATSGANNAVSPNEQTIKICVDRILEILKEKKER